MLTNLFVFGAAIYFIVKGAMLSSKYAVLFAKEFHVSTYIVGVVIVAIISILPETFISVSSLFAGEPTLGLGTLLGSNVADLTLVFAIVILFSGRLHIKIKNSILSHNKLYTIFLLVPIVLGLDGSYTRFEGISLILIGFLYYYNTINAHQQVTTTKPPVQKDIPSMINNLVYLLGSIALLLLGAHFVVTSGIAIAEAIGVSPVIIGIGVIGLGTVIPELLFAFHAVKQYKDELAVGDLLGTVLADATIVIGIMATILPFEFPEKIIYVTGLFMVTGGILNGYFMSTEKVLAKKEGVFLLLFRIVFVVTEYLINK